MKYLPLASLTLVFLLTGCTQYANVREHRRTANLATTAEQRAVVKSLETLPNDPLVQLGGYLDAADAARLRLAADPKDVLAQSNYNFAVARIVEIVSDKRLTPWEDRLICPSATGAPWKLGLIPPDPRPQFHPSKLEFSSTDRLTFSGTLVGERSAMTGLGAPVVAMGKDITPSSTGGFGQGEKLFYGLTASVRFSGRTCDLMFSDPLEKETLKLDNQTYTLAADVQAPLAMSLAGFNVRRFELREMFRPDLFENSAKLTRLEPYNPKKIPVLFVHGLSNSPAIFAPVIEFLRSDPQIRRNYQFWVFGYPTGLPYPMSAAILRYQLDQMKKLYPNHKDIVLIGHSMGGMISRLILTDSDMKIWNTFFDRPPDQIPFSKEARNLMSRSLIFKSRDDISRAVFLSASHRGSDLATNFMGRMGATLVGNPISQSRVNKEVYAYVRPEVRVGGRHRLPNSIDMLDPENRFLKTANALPLRTGVPFHSLIGDRGRGGNLDRTKPYSNDGIVPYWSSHQAGARSEQIIPSGHWSHLHPLGMVEIKRILNEHLQ
ncbi:MAG: alpha/beta fold hydrolase [Terrimicrobiaceae bacterium]